MLIEENKQALAKQGTSARVYATLLLTERIYIVRRVPRDALCSHFCRDCKIMNMYSPFSVYKRATLPGKLAVQHARLTLPRATTWPLPPPQVQCPQAVLHSVLWCLVTGSDDTPATDIRRLLFRVIDPSR